VGFSALGDVFLAGKSEQPTAASPQKLSEAAEAWDRTKDTTSIAAFEAFLARFKDTYYADLVRLRIEELKKQQVAIATPPSRSPAPKPPHPACDGIEITVGQSERRCLKPGAGKTEHFQDCPTCPEMVVVLSGAFTMGSPASEPQRSDSEARVHVSIAAPFVIRADLSRPHRSAESCASCSLPSRVIYGRVALTWGLREALPHSTTDGSARSGRQGPGAAAAKAAVATTGQSSFFVKSWTRTTSLTADPTSVNCKRSGTPTFP
jgi:hypothetical protein